MMADASFFQTELLRYVTARVKDRSLAEDIVHDVFIKVQVKSMQLREEEKKLRWIFRIANNAIIDHFRSRAKVVKEEDLDWDSDERYLNQCVEQCLSEMLLTLPSKYREALELSEVRGLSQVELARQLNLSYSGVKSRVQRARQMLRERMDREYRIEADHYGNITTCENRVPCECENK